jgi:GT2 family glycosyltransferase
MPYSIIDIDIALPLRALVVPEGHTGLALIIRRAGRPAGFVMRELPARSTLTAEDLARLIDGHYARISEERQLPRVAAPDSPAASPLVTVAVCTKDNPHDLKICLKRLLAVASAEPEGIVEILVVDNAPSDSRTQELVAALPGVHYALEPKPGLDFARNRAIQEATGELIAFVDDDVTVDRGWLEGLRKALAEHPDAAAVTGLVLPAELMTEAQILFEKRGGFEKKFETTRFGPTLPGHPFYPCVGGKFGTGCNMAFRRRVLRELGGFDEALDTGAALPGGGDTDMFYRVVRAGYPLVYEPQFLVFHRHRRELRQLRRQYARSWGMGLMAYVAKTYRYDAEQRPNLRRLVTWWLGNEVRELARSLRGNHVLAPGMLLAELWGGIVGLCGAYGRSQRRARQIRRRHSASPAVRADSSASAARSRL